MEGNSISIVPEGWDNSDRTDASDGDDTESECNSSSQSIPLSRYPSLAELSTIATNCDNTTSVVSDESYLQEQGTMLAPPHAVDDGNQISSQLNCNNIWSQNLPATPPKVVNTSTTSTNQTGDDPLTPTANLKMLVSAASPAIRDREIKKRELFPGQNISTLESLQAAASLGLISNARQSGSLGEDKIANEQSTPVEAGVDKITVSRKDKSLGLLCQKFLSKYPEYPHKNQFIEIGLDEVARDLNVERRRIYDIVNVLESVEVISRYAKNRYVWHGKSRLPSTLIKLKHYAVTKGLTLKPSWTGKENPEPKPATEVKKEKSQVKKTPLVLSTKLPMILPKDPNLFALMQNFTSTICLDQNLMPPPAMLESNPEDIANRKLKFKVDGDYCRKDKSLGVLSQKFLMMFLVSENRYVTLEDAANLLIGDEAEGKSKYKTKVRRLYDIANILSSLQLIEKVHIHSIQSGRKPGFRWIGIDPDKLEDSTANNQGQHIKEPPAVKRMCGPKSTEEEDESALGRLIWRRPSQQQMRARSAEAAATSKTKLPRSRSERVLGSKKRELSGEEDGFSVQELTASFGADPSAASPTEVKFRAELKKLHQQYPDRMSQLLSACRQGFPDDVDTKKSRRSLFMSANTEPEDAPKVKRRRSADDAISIKEEIEASFSHSSTSPFKRAAGEKTDPTPSSSRQTSPNNKPSQASPEQKILLERQKQQKLLEQQRDFDSQDERWKRIERELEKAFPKAGLSRPAMVHQSSSPLPYDALVEQSSVAIQASLIDDLSPLKPLSYYHKLKSPWKSDTFQVSCSASASPSPVPFQNAAAMSPFANPHALSPVPILPATERPTHAGNACSGNGLLFQIPPPSGTSVVWATPTPPSGSSTPSPSQFIRMSGQTLHTPALYSPRSLTPTPEPGQLDSSQTSFVVDKQRATMAAPLLTMPDNVCQVESSPLLFAGSQSLGAGNRRIPAQQALSVQVSSTGIHLSNAEILSVTPIPGNMTSVQFSTPFSKISDMNSAVCTETPSSTVQLLADVSKRLSLPLARDHSS